MSFERGGRRLVRFLRIFSRRARLQQNRSVYGDFGAGSKLRDLRARLLFKLVRAL